MNRPLIGAAIAAGACFAALSGCRGVLGIDDLDVVSDGGTGSSSGDSSAGADARADAPPNDAATGADTSTPVDCKTSGDCPMCCHMSAATKDGFFELVKVAADAGCLCGGGGACPACADTACKTPPEMPAAGTCGQCVDSTIRMMPGPQACETAKMRCGPNAACKAYLDCITNCN